MTPSTVAEPVSSSGRGTNQLRSLEPSPVLKSQYNWRLPLIVIRKLDLCFDRRLRQQTNVYVPYTFRLFHHKKTSSKDPHPCRGKFNLACQPSPFLSSQPCRHPESSTDSSKGAAVHVEVPENTGLTFLRGPLLRKRIHRSHASCLARRIPQSAHR